MAAQGGMKHAATEPTRLDKRERNRSAGGRAAALRRAPSDSDCSGETASLSADSGDRVRPKPMPARAGKTRSRRRGSEWEVLEGLKDGQRFDRRPEVFNGYLHKKRKWPLKGWHKRFFVVDGGILVYARSQSDVARGRLHGSVDVGLSVISAKQRRRRIDIDADEFIYHLRAKTPDVFRTWLNVLKAHRLYRQHLLTFGARESVPKIHAPLDDLPPTDVSSRTSSSTDYTSSTSDLTETSKHSHSAKSAALLKEIKPYKDISIRVYTSPISHRCNTVLSPTKNDVTAKQNHPFASTENTVSVCLTCNPINMVQNKKDVSPKRDDKSVMCTRNIFICPRCNPFVKSINNTGEITNKEFYETKLTPVESSDLTPVESNKDVAFNLKKDICHSLCSMKCVAKRNNTFVKSPSPFEGATDVEKTMTSTDLDDLSLKTDTLMKSSFVCAYTYNEPKNNAYYVRTSTKYSNYSNLSREHKVSKRNSSANKPDKSALYFFSQKNNDDQPAMKKSMKCTNLVKYKMQPEPILSKPLSKCMLLNEKKVKENKMIGMAAVHKKNNETQATSEKRTKSLQDEMTKSEYDALTEKLITRLLGGNTDKPTAEQKNDINYYISKMVQEIYEIKLNQQETHPVKILFRCLLEYWLKNTSTCQNNSYNNLNRKARSISRPSINYFTRDANISGVNTRNETKETQIDDGYSTRQRRRPNDKKYHETKPSDSYEKERRVQQLERLLKNTVYICETVRSNQSREKDIQITKRLMDNLGKFPNSNGSSNDKEDRSNSSAEYPMIQETFNRFISETSIPPDVAKEFLGAYLEVLMHDSQQSNRNSSSYTSNSKYSQEHDSNGPICEVLAESVQKRVSKSITAFEIGDTDKKNKTFGSNNDDSGQIYLKDILEKITSLFKVKKPAPRYVDRDVQPDDTNVEGSLKQGLRIPVVEYLGSNVVPNNSEENAVVIDLSKYDLEQISMLSDPYIKGHVSLSLRLKERPPSFGESRAVNLSFRFSSDNDNKLHTNYSTKKVFHNQIDPHISFKNPYVDYDPKLNGLKDKYELIPFKSNSDTCNLCSFIRDSERSVNFAYKNKHYTENSPTGSRNTDGDGQSCYLLANIKKSTPFQTKKKVRLKEFHGILTKGKNQYKRRYSEMDIHKTPRYVDEKLILVLLENLCILTQNMPSMHKEIKALHTKLLKRHERDGRKPSLGLLGKIYQEESTDIGLQFGTPDSKCYKENTTLTSGLCVIHTHNKTDKCLSAIQFYPTVNSVLTQTHKTYNCKSTDYKSVLIDDTSNNEPNLLLPLYSKPTKIPCNWYEKLIRKDCAIGVAIKTILDKTNMEYNANKYRDDSSRLKQELIEETNRLNSSIQSQTVEILTKDHKSECNLNYLFMSKKYDAKSSLSTVALSAKNLSDDLKTIYKCNSERSVYSGLVSPTSPPLRGPQAGFVSGTPGGRLAGWIIESGGPLENASRELGQAQLSVQQLQRLLDALELQHQAHHDTDVSLDGASPNVKKDRRKFGLRKKKSNSSKCASVDLAPPPQHIDSSSSHTALSALTAPPSPGGGAPSVPNMAASLPIACAAARPQSLPGAECLAAAAGPASLTSLTPDQQLREDFTVLAKDLLATLKGVVSTLVCERGRLRAAMEAADSTASPGGAVVAALRTNLTSALQQNSELRSRLSRIHDASDLAEISSVNNTDPVNRHLQQSLSYSSSCVSASEFFDAEEHDELKSAADLLAGDEAGVIELDGDSSSEAGSLSSEEGSASSDNSDGALLSAEPHRASPPPPPLPPCWARRTALPCPRPTPGGPSLWNLLYKNIGKDLSQISMPVTINEPLNMLQRLCEELEYSELLDTAAECKNPVERMALIAAFAVSAYAASAHRAASKPFNPLLAETYECIRDDKGFRFIAEQVSHHPPISACHAESPRWCFWQEARIKTKFWGKSMEFQPTGRVHVRLLTTGDHYSWNKVTTCVHNLFGGQRWVDQYGDMHITCHGTEISCKLNFIKASSWSSSRHEVRGSVTDGATGTRLRLQGRWSEALYAGDPPANRCLWRPGAMPPEHEIYYGFTRFAMELNELEPGMREVLPPTDTRFRPDQRALEEGDVEAAEQFKLELEQAQRERRRDSPEHTPAWFRKINSEGEETWTFTGEYWSARDSGFPKLRAPRIW